ncbi:hypothetical protein SDC9_135083 [bioreactor metagenome]|uniref:Uncharacterized protein n=1 Tax=bioreactor metagenome TaxID=1076179 RepID=A0A645DHB3_9ZZZZ
MLHTDLTAFKARLTGGTAAGEALHDLEQSRRETMERSAAAGQLDRERRTLDQRELEILARYRQNLLGGDIGDKDALDAVRGWFATEVEARKAAAQTAGRCFDNAFRYLEETFGDSQELVIFVTEITAGYDTSWFVEHFGCDAYFRHNRELLFDDSRRRIREEIAAERAGK